TYGHIGDQIPLAVYNIAVRAGWIKEQEDMEEREYYSREDADLFGGMLRFTASFKEWFLELISEAVAELEAVAEKNVEEQARYRQKLFEYYMDEISRIQPGSNRKNPILKQFFDKSKNIVNITDLANAANEVGKTMTPPVAVTRVSVSRIYNQHGYV